MAKQVSLLHYSEVQCYFERLYEVGELEKHTVILRKSTISTLNELKRKFNIPMYVLINIAIKEGISILENRL